MTAATTFTVTINMTDSDVAPAWLGLCLTAQPGAQDSGRVRYVVTVDGAHADELWAALDADPEVTDYEVDEVAAECPACDGSGRVPTFERPCGVDCCGWGTEMCHACRGLGVVAAIALTAETITTAQIRALRTEAATAGDLEQVEICDLALSGSSIRHLSIRGADGRVVSVEEDCRELCADAINAGQG